MEEPAFEPIPELVEDANPEATAPAQLGAGIDTAAVPPQPPEPQARRGVLPPPKSDGKRVQPLASRGQRTRSDPKRPSASGLPSGMRAPGVPEQTDAENTDILIASAVAALTEGDPADNSSVLLTPEPLVAAATSVSTLRSVGPEPQPQPQPEGSKRRGALWVGVAAAAALVVLAIAFSSGGDDAPEPASASAAVALADKQPNKPANAPTAENPPAAMSPDLPSPALDSPPDVGGAWVELEDATDLGGEVAAALDVGSAEIEDDDPEADGQADGQDEVAVAASSRPNTRGRKRKRESKAPSSSSPRPAPAAPAKPPEDAATLLASARKALASGQARKAYALASKSRSAKRTSAALVVMAKAACRFGGASQAKSAFNQLSVANRRGLRAECRNHGVRLGI